MIARKVNEHVFTLDDGKDIDYVSLEEQFSAYTQAICNEDKEQESINKLNKRYMNDEIMTEEK